MLHRIHQKLGTAGFIISIVALVAALGGGAYAASGGLTGKQKKEVEKIAKKYAGKPGATGQPGAPGAKGDTGANGAKGDAGSAGGAGANGASVTTATLAPGPACPTGGINVTSSSGTTPVCNGSAGQEGEPGQVGSPWTAGGTLPKGSTETGAYVVGPSTEEQFVTRASISFSIPLASDGAVQLERVEHEGASTANCPGSQEAPSAKPGFLCVYEGQSNGLAFETWLNPENAEGEEVGAVGALLKYSVEAGENSAKGYGVWAVTAP